MTEHSTVIKKYSDRRLYHSSARRYVNLGEIARMIRAGVNVKVVDARTGKDLTRMILTQIIMEDARDGEAGLPLKLLHQLVVASDRATHEYLPYLEAAFELYKKAGALLRSRVVEAKSALASPIESLLHLVSGQAPSPEKDSEEVVKLRRRVRELEARLARRERRRTTKK